MLLSWMYILSNDGRLCQIWCVILGKMVCYPGKNGVLSWEGGQEKVKIDLLIGGSPCKNFSQAMTAEKRKGFDG